MEAPREGVKIVWKYCNQSVSAQCLMALLCSDVPLPYLESEADILSHFWAVVLKEEEFPEHCVIICGISPLVTHSRWQHQDTQGVPEGLLDRPKPPWSKHQLLSWSSAHHPVKVPKDCDTNFRITLWKTQNSNSPVLEFQHKTVSVLYDHWYPNNIQ